MEKVKYRMSALINMGAVRQNNEDNFIVSTNLTSNNWIINNDEIQLDKKGALFVVADGMGGMNAGEVASNIVVNSVKQQFSDIQNDIYGSPQNISSFLKSVIQNADREILEHTKKNPETMGMGTTVVILWLIDKTAYVAWCGDSRAYMYHPDMGLKQVSKDHSYVQELVDKGVLTTEQAFYHPDSNIITRSLGSEGKPAEAEVVNLKLFNGVRFVLCSDGLNSMLTDQQIEQILSSHSDIKECNDKLIIDAIEAGGHDNITVILTDIISGAEKYVDLGINDICVESKKLPKYRRVKTTIVSLLIMLIVVVVFLAGGKFYPQIQALFIRDTTSSIVVVDTVVINNGITDEKNVIDNTITDSLNTQAVVEEGGNYTTADKKEVEVPIQEIDNLEKEKVIRDSLLHEEQSPEIDSKSKLTPISTKGTITEIKTKEEQLVDSIIIETTESKTKLDTLGFNQQ